MSDYENIKLLAMSVEDGCTSQALTCPSCNGGRNNEKSFYITKELGLIKYICFRASCPCRGIIGDNPNNPKQAKKDKKPMPFRHPTEELPEHYIEWLSKKFGIVCDNWVMDSSTGRVVMPVVHANGYTIGHVSRNYPELTSMPSGNAKTIAYWESVTQLPMHFRLCGDSTTLVLVEDIVSCEKVGCFTSCAALLGTNLNDSMATQLLKMGWERIILWLDADAYGKAVGYAQQYNPVFPKGADVLFTEKDPKDLPYDVIREYLG